MNNHRVLLIFLTVMICLGSVGCTKYIKKLFISTEDQQKLDSAEKKVEKLGMEFEEVGEQVQGIMKKIDEVTEKHAAGEMTAKEYAELAPRLVKEYNDAVKNWNDIEKAGKEAIAEYKNIKSETDLSWWAIGYSILSTAIGLYTGRSALNFRNGLQLVANTIESEVDKSAIKAKLKDVGNTVVNNAAARADPKRATV